MIFPYHFDTRYTEVCFLTLFLFLLVSDKTYKSVFSEEVIAGIVRFFFHFTVLPIILEPEVS